MRTFGIWYDDPPLNSIRCQIEAPGRLLKAIDAIRQEMRNPRRLTV